MLGDQFRKNVNHFSLKLDDNTRDYQVLKGGESFIR
jgi:hypothetical protein